MTKLFETELAVGQRIKMANGQVVKITEISEQFDHVERKLGSNEQRDVYKLCAIFDGGPYRASIETLEKGLASGRYQRGDN